MKIIVNKDSIEGIMSLMKEVVNQKTPLPILLNVLIDVKGDDVTITGGDGTKTLIMRCKTEEPNTEEAHFCVNTLMMCNALHDMPDEPVSMELEGSRLTIHYEGGYTYMPTLPADDYIVPAETEYKDRMPLPGLWVSGIIKRTIWATAKDDFRPVQTCIHIAQVDGGLDLVATDSRSLVRNHFLVEDQTDNASASVSIPRDVADLLTRLPLTADTEIEWTETSAHIKMGDHDVFFSLCVEKYPNYNAVIPKATEIKSTATVSKRELFEALRRVAPFTNSSASCRAVIEVNADGLSVCGQDIEVETGAYNIIEVVEASGPDMKFGVSATQLMAELKNIVATNVTLRTVDYKHAIIVEPAEDEQTEKESVLMLAMPMRVDEE